MTDLEPVAEQSDEARNHLRLEASTMALYVAIVLLGTFVAVGDVGEGSQLRLAGVIWGTTFGLVLAHYFAFRVAGRIHHGRGFDPQAVRIAIAQLSGAAGVAVLCTIPVLLFPVQNEDNAIRIVLALIIGVAGYATGRTAGSSRWRSVFQGVVIAIGGLAVALIENVITGH